ncbi:MAG TPA: hypothetical protein VL172_09780 [Kofleriaceae bacterium]|nr:hypothetical protein [Kofleriaceae bacterium]
MSLKPWRFGVLAALWASLADPGRAHAWYYSEHLSLGSEAYAAACAHITARVGDAPAPEVRIRLEIACDNLGIAAALYGQATALAGDRFDRPQDFLATGSGWKVASRGQYYGLALANTTHFHPAAPREWRRYHRQALDHALAASRGKGMDAVDGLQRALFENAFADHFLHDSFSSGHMGFNREASSVSASLVFHRTWNKRGRTIRDRAGSSWRTYGDGLLEDPRNAKGRAHVLAAATVSIEGVLSTFVLGARDTDHELIIWRTLPFVIDAPELPSVLDRVFGEKEEVRHLHPLAAINWPAHKDQVIDLRTLVTGPLSGGDPLIVELAGFHVSLPLVSTRVHLGVGGTVPYGDRRLHLAGDIGLTTHLGNTAQGVFDHQLGAGALLEVQKGKPSGSVWCGYIVNLEAGVNLLQLQAGPAFVMPDQEIGYTVGIAFARVLSAAGGGVR